MLDSVALMNCDIMALRCFQCYLFGLLGLLLLTEGIATTVEEDMALFNSLERALATDRNTYMLQKRSHHTEGIPDDVMKVFICQDKFTVKHIANTMNTTEDRAFTYNESCDCFVRQYSYYQQCRPSDSDNPCDDYYDAFEISNYDGSSFFVRDFFDDVVTFDATFSSILVYFINSPQLHGHNFIYKRPQASNAYRRTLDLSLDYLPTNPSNEELSEMLVSALAWVKHNTRMNSLGFAQGLDSDRAFVADACRRSRKGFIKNDLSSNLHLTLLVTLKLSLNTVIMLIGLYIFHLATSNKYCKWVLEKLGSFKTVNIVFWSTVVALAFINIGCFFIEVFFLMYHVQSYRAYFVANPPLLLVIMLFEAYVIYLNTEEATDVHHYIVSIHNFAVFNILWCFHRVGNCFIVSTYFAAIAPSHTVAIITLCLVFFVLFIITIAIGIHLFYFFEAHEVFVGFAIVLLFLFAPLFFGLVLHPLFTPLFGTIVVSVSILCGMIFADIAKHLKEHNFKSVEEKLTKKNISKSETDMSDESDNDEGEERPYTFQIMELKSDDKQNPSGYWGYLVASLKSTKEFIDDKLEEISGD